MTPRVALASLSMVMVLAAPASAQEAKSKKKRGAKAEPGRAAQSGTPDHLEFGGRVYVRDTLSGVDVVDDTVWLQDRKLDTARVFLTFRPNQRTRMDLEVDFSGDQAELKDTFIRYDALPGLDLTAGRFKRPVSFLGLESTWDLPRIDRGLLSELRIDDRRLLFAGGRGDGLAVRLQPAVNFDPEVTLAVQDSGLAEDLVLEVSDGKQDLFARLEAKLAADVRLAAAFGWVGSLHDRSDLDSYRHRPFGTIEGFFAAGGTRVWLEGMAGLNATTYVDGRRIGRFAAAQALVAHRIERVGTLRALEPYAAAGWYEPSTLQPDDQLAEVTGGAAVWLSGKLRLQLEVGRRIAQDAAASADATVVRAQIGMAFKSKTELR